MAKDTYYFSHDYNARTDVKIKRLIAKLGMTGYGIFWAIVEDLYNNANALPLDCESIAYDLRTDEQTIDMVINDFDLFVIEGLQFGSMSVQKRLDERAKKSNQARDNACKRWIKSEGDANAMPPHSKPNAIKESKGKEKKERKVKESEAMPSAVLPFGDDFKAQWNIWKDFKKKQFRFVYASTGSEQAAINHLVKLGGGIEQTAIAIIHQSMANGWKGFFELKNENNAITNQPQARPFTNNSKRVFTADQLDPSGRLRGTLILKSDAPNFRAAKFNDQRAYDLQRVQMISELDKMLGYIKGGHIFTSEMATEFVDMVMNEFPNWKLSDFILFLDKAKRGEFKSDFEHTIDFPTLFKWTHDYDNLLLEVIERNMKPVVESSPETHTNTTESSEDVLRAFYAQMKLKREIKDIEHQKRMEKYPDQWADMREAQQAYRQASLDHATELEGENANGFRILAARQEWEQANPENEWVSNWIEMYKHYKINIE